MQPGYFRRTLEPKLQEKITDLLEGQTAEE